MSDSTRPVGLALIHIVPAFILFLAAAVMGLFQVAVRAEMVPEFLMSSELYYASVTAHGTVMGYVFTTFFIVGFGYYTAATSLKRKIWAPGLAWAGFVIMLVGTLMAAYVMFTGQASVLYTFYPPNTAHWMYYVGATLLVVGSWFWVITMVAMHLQWKKENPGQPVPLPMFATTANAWLWFLTSLGVALEVLLQLIPLVFGLVDTIDVGLARTLFSWTLHPIVYFWLIPAYIGLYSLMPAAAKGRLISDEMARVAFIMLVVFGLPIGFHHLYMDPFHDDGWKLLHAFGTFMVAVPTLITGFTVIASLEIAGRMNGGKGLFGWIGAVDWKQPMVLAAGLGLLLLTFAGFGGVINASYALNVAVHNTMWVPAHFHAMLGGTVVLIYFGIAYYLWPSMTGKKVSDSMAGLQLGLWAIGMVVVTIPWHIVGLLHQPRRTAWSPYGEEVTAKWDSWEVAMVIGAAMLVLSALLLLWNLLTASEKVEDRDVAYAEPVHAPVKLPETLNGFGLWLWILAIYMVVSFGYPILQFLLPGDMGGLQLYNPVPWGF